MRWTFRLFCDWCHGQRTKGELYSYRGHSLICRACTHTYKVSKEDYSPLNKKG